jgi:DnaJ like chaperone protein
MKDDSPIHILWLPTIAAAGIAYIASFIDLIPDITPIGWLDDLAVVIGLVWFFTSWLPKNRHRIYLFRSPQDEKRQSRGESTQRPSAERGQPPFDPFQVLNVNKGASADEIERAYKTMLTKYHPDKVAHLGKEFQTIAHEKVINIKKAYEMLGGRG